MNSNTDVKLQVQSATDIVELIGQHVTLKRKGREFVGLCPFHDDRTPSMYVVPDKQIFHCFSCGAGGDSITFTMRHLRMSFPEALRFLADRAGVELPAWKPSGMRRRGAASGGGDGGGQEDGGDSGSGGGGSGGGSSGADRQALVESHERVANWFQSQLADPQVGRVALDYLRERGISEESIKAFRIGVAPEGWHNLCEVAARRNWPRKSLEAAGLVIISEKSGQPHDRFRNRLIFPICDAAGRPIAFGGRKLNPEDEPKYLNSPEHPLFDKGANLYGLHLARKAMAQSETVVVVEGYTDVIACHQAGVCNVVATLGTALTPRHAKLLQRYVNRVILVFDGDEAGRKATDRAIELFLSGTLDVAMTTLPDGLDPADLLARPDGVERWNEAMSRAVDSLEALLDRLKGRLAGQETISGRQQVAEDLIRILAEGGLDRLNPIRRGMVIDRIGGLLGLPGSTVRQRLEEVSRLSRQRRTMREQFEGSSHEEPETAIEDGDAAALPRWPSLEEQPTHEARRAVLAQRLLVGLILLEPDRFHELLPDGVSVFEAIGIEDMVADASREVFSRLLPDLLEHKPVGSSRLSL
ncbi:MAG: toprim domain-containing protein, partial [Phycisphaeraceae bacterium]|nr:toprim domain-containing protein [Phycisphaeraceae bacterium]